MYRIILVTQSDRFIQKFTAKLSELGHSCLSFDAFEAETETSEPLIVVVDIQSFRMTFRDLEMFLKEYPYPMLVLSAIPSFEEGYPLLRMGVKGYANIHLGLVNLENALNVLSSGGSWFDTGFMNDFIRRIDYQGSVGNHNEIGDLEVLSEREREIGRYVAQGLSNHQIAQTLEISERTVKAHLLACYKKLGMNDRVSLALWFKKSDHVQ